MMAEEKMTGALKRILAMAVVVMIAAAFLFWSALRVLGMV